MTTITNHDRYLRAARAIAFYGDDIDESNLIDFLADAMHWCDYHGNDFNSCLEIAREHHSAEINGED